MIFFRPGSQVHRLTAVLAIAGEIPVSDLFWFGSQRTVRALVAQLVETQTLRNTLTGEELTCRLLKLHGKGSGKTIRFYKAGLPVLDWLGVKKYYLASFWNHNFPSDPAHRSRMNRVAETLLILPHANVEFRAWRLPELSLDQFQNLAFSKPGYYLARDLKKVATDDESKISFSRITGAILTADSLLPVFNTQDAVMKWNGEGEQKTQLSLLNLAQKNIRVKQVDAAILLGKSDDTAIRTMAEMKATRRLSLRFDIVYRFIYYVPLRKEGVDQLRLLLTPDWNERLLSAMFTPAQRSYNRGSFEYDAIVDGTYIFCFFDGDIARLNRLREALETDNIFCQLLCFPFQVSLVRQALGDLVDIRIYAPGDVLNALGIERRTIFES